MDSKNNNEIYEISSETPKRSKIIHKLPSARSYENFHTPLQSPIKSSRIPTKRNSTLRKLPTPRLTATKSSTTTEVTRVWNTVEGETNYQKFESEIDGYFNTSKNQNNNSFNSHKSNSTTDFNNSHGDASRNKNILFSPVQSPKPNYSAFKKTGPTALRQPVASGFLRYLWLTTNYGLQQTGKHRFLTLFYIEYPLVRVQTPLKYQKKPKFWLSDIFGLAEPSPTVELHFHFKFHCFDTTKARQQHT